LAIEELKLSKSEILITYSGGDRGWKADVPVVRLDPTKIDSFGWKPKHTSFESIKRSLGELNAGLK
jgi:UDP-glucose 4-epimerase